MNEFTYATAVIASISDQKCILMALAIYTATVRIAFYIYTIHIIYNECVSDAELRGVVSE